MTLWFDVEDLIGYFQAAARPTGIQRFCLETLAAASRVQPNIRLCRRSTGNACTQVDAAALSAALHARLATPQPPAPQPKSTPRLPTLPPRVLMPLAQLARATRAGAAALRDLAALPFTSPLRLPKGPPASFAPGDWLISLGASWQRPYTPAFLAQLAASGAHLALTAHDLIPALFPEWSTSRNTAEFTTWLTQTVPHADALFAVSHHTAADLQRLLPGAPRVTVLPMGSSAARTAPRLIPTPYILTVGTLEARKNHAGLLRIWRALPNPPLLVIAGKRGWLTADLQQQLENSAYLNGKIRLIEHADDVTLTSLYQHCLFTVFPSFYEGWGLPVSESLAHGKLVAASHRSAIPEAGGDFCAYFDPDNLTQAAATIAHLLDHPEDVAAMEARIAAQYRPPSWDDTAAALLSALRQT